MTKEGKEIIIDESQLAARHTIVIGSTGSGKTTAMLAIGVRKYAQGCDVYYVTIKSDDGTQFLNVARELGTDGQIVELGPKANPNEPVYNINILDIITPDIEFNPEIIFYGHISTLKNFFMVLWENSVGKSDNMPAYIEKSLSKLYYDFGYRTDDPHTWHPEISPTLLDLVAIWEKDAEDDNETAEALVNKSSLFHNTGKFLSNQTNINLNARFVVIDLSGIKKVDKQLAAAMNYYMTIMLSNRMFTRSERKKVLMVDEARVFFKNPLLSEQLVQYITQLRSFGGELIISALEVSDFADVSQEILANVYKKLILGNNSRNVLDIISKTFKLSPSSQKYLHDCTKAGQGVLMVSSPFHQEYQLQLELSDKEAEIILGQKQTPNSGYRFLKPAFEILAQENRVIMANWIEGDCSVLKNTWDIYQSQNTFGDGSVTAYIEPGFMQDDMLWNQGKDHYCTVLQIAGFGINHGCEVTVNHNSDADDVFKLPNGNTLAIEYQTSDDHVHEKRLKHESRYGRLLFVGNTASCADMKAAFNNSDEQRKIAKQIIVPRGAQLAKRLEEILNESGAEKV